MATLKKYVCTKCGQMFEFENDINNDCKCLNCNGDIKYIGSITEDKEITQKQNMLEDEENISIIDIYNDVHSIKSMVKFFVILTIINILCTIIPSLIK